MSKGENGKTMDENSALMANGRMTTPEKQSYAQFFYNKNNGTVLGKSAKAWFQLLIFYIIFYAFLAAFWYSCLRIFLSTIDPALPRYYGTGTIIGANPGVGYQPWLEDNPESTLIEFDKKDPESYAKYVNALNKYLEKYLKTNQTRTCTGNESNSDVIAGGKKLTEHAKACRFDLTEFENAGCNQKNNYGFSDGKPCIIVSLNRLIGWEPADYDPDMVPKEIQSRYKKGSIAFNCNGINEPDRERLGEVNYLPKEGIDGRFYPYAVMDNYHQPIAMVKFNNLPTNRIVMVECRAFAKNIEQEVESRLGMVNFELLLKNVSPNQKEL